MNVTRLHCDSEMETHHHQHRVAGTWQDIAVSTSFRHLERSCTRFHAKMETAVLQ